MDELQIFSFESTSVRTVIIDGQLWVVLRDVCDALELSDVSMTASRLDEDEKLNKPDLSSLGQREGNEDDLSRAFGEIVAILRAISPRCICSMFIN